MNTRAVQDANETARTEARERANAAPSPDEDMRAKVDIRARPPSPLRLSRRVLVGGALGVAALVAFAVLNGLSDHPRRAHGSSGEDAPAAPPSPPEDLRALPDRYNGFDLGVSEPNASGDKLWGDHAPGQDLAPPQDAAWTRQGGAGQIGAPAPDRQAQDPEMQDPEMQARGSAIFFSTRAQGLRVRADGADYAGAAGVNTDALALDALALDASASLDASAPRGAFLAGQRGSETLLAARAAPPPGGYVLQAGAIIPAALVTGLHSDLPGRVIAQVTAPVYDSVTGDALLVPQGARLIGAYDANNVHGARRLFLVWNRLVLPNGASISLGAMEATDPEGAAGLGDHTDNHLPGLAGAIGLSALMSVIGNNAEGEDEASLTRSVGDAAAQEAARTGGRIIDRELDVAPTLKVRPGAPVRVLVTRDIVLGAYPS